MASNIDHFLIFATNTLNSKFAIKSKLSDH